MDLGIIIAIAMLIAWSIGTFVLSAGGWIHLLLTLGVSLLIYRIVVRGTQRARARDDHAAGGGGRPA